MTHVYSFQYYTFNTLLPLYSLASFCIGIAVIQNKSGYKVLRDSLPFKPAYSINVCTFVQLATYAKPSISLFCHLFLKLLGGTLSYNFQQISNRLVLKILAHLLRKIRKISEIGRYNI